MKRALDLLGSSVGLVLLAPLLAAIAAIVRLSLGRPVLFRQLRPGLEARPFVLYKFRTMRHARDEDGEPMSDAARMTRIGAFLRSTSLDELPELWNVLRGDMSLVGPRPLLMEYVPLYTAWQARRHAVRPGITGWAQVNGRNAARWEERFEMDVWYVDNRSFLLDLRILIRTTISVLRRDGINQPGQVTVEPFQGSDTSVTTEKRQSGYT